MLRFDEYSICTLSYISQQITPLRYSYVQIPPHAGPAFHTMSARANPGAELERCATLISSTWHPASPVRPRRCSGLLY